MKTRDYLDRTLYALPKTREDLDRALYALQLELPGAVHEAVTAIVTGYVDQLLEEIEALRQYGNKDCTHMADVALTERRAAAGDPTPVDRSTGVHTGKLTFIAICAACAAVRKETNRFVHTVELDTNCFFALRRELAMSDASTDEFRMYVAGKSVRVMVGRGIRGIRFNAA